MAKALEPFLKAILHPTVLVALVGVAASITVALIQRPTTIRETKESISAITIPDEQLQRLARAVLRLEAGTSVTSGFLIEQRYLVTTDIPFVKGSKGARIYRRFGAPDSASVELTPTVRDTENGIAVFDFGVSDARATPLELRGDLERKTFDRIFALGYVGGKVLSVREGRIVADRVDNPRFYHPDLVNYRVPVGALVGDIQIPGGMGGAPVFLKDGSLIGFVYLALNDPGIALIVPSSYVGDAILKAKGGR